MTRPVRLRLSRAKGFNLQAHSLATNGLPAVNCARPTGYGNPFVVGELPSFVWAKYTKNRVETAEEAVSLFRTCCIDNALHYDRTADMIAALHGKNLACWCALDGQPCHADVLLELANPPLTGPAA